MTDWTGHHPRFHKLLAFLSLIPGIELNETPSGGLGSGLDDGRWWVQFSISVDHPLAWTVVQELAHVLNYLSVAERRPPYSSPHRRRRT